MRISLRRLGLGVLSKVLSTFENPNNERPDAADREPRCQWNPREFSSRIRLHSRKIITTSRSVFQKEDVLDHV